MGKGEIAHYKQFLLFPQRFQKACFPGASKGVIVWEWVDIHTFTTNGKPFTRSDESLSCGHKNHLQTADQSERRASWYERKKSVLVISISQISCHAF